MHRQESTHNAMTADGHFSGAYTLRNGNSLGKDIVNEVKSCFDEVNVLTYFYRISFIFLAIKVKSKKILHYNCDQSPQKIRKKVTDMIKG